jgi:hypothetical protein
MLESVYRFLPGFFGERNGDVCSLFHAEDGVRACVNAGMVGNRRGLLRAVRLIYADRPRDLAEFIHGHIGALHGLFADPDDRVSSLFGSLPNRMDDDVAAFLADELGAFRDILPPRTVVF